MNQDRIRLLQVTHDLEIGGLQRVVATLCRAVDQTRFDVRVLCLRALGPFTANIEQLGIPVTLIPQTGKTDYLSFLKVARILRSERIDVIHTHNTQPFIDGTLAALLSGVRTIVHTDHARDFPDKRRYMVAERVMATFAYRVVGVSEHTSANLQRYERIPGRKIETIPNGIDGSVFDIPVDREAKRRKLGIPDDAVVLGIGVRLTDQKGITYLLKALPKVVARFPRVVLVVAGEGPLEEDLRVEAEHLELAGHVKFVGPRTDMPELLKVFDLYVLPSLWEGLPMVLLEAMAAGCPIVATNVGGVSSAIETGVNGMLVPPSDPEGLADAITTLLGDQSLRRRFAENARQVFEMRFSAETMTRRYERLYLRQG
ncbi:MAG TPA: glycosyltransferase [Vicinamibacterales bacterium]|jgi:glycosyltransferase involved in cell wall biosynthesis